MRSFVIGVALYVCVIPFVSHAAVNAGVVNGIWFSTDTFIEQTSVEIFAAIQNESSETISGTVQFFVDDNAIGTTTFSALPATMVRASLPYTFTPGTHSVSGRISSTDGNLSLLYEELPLRSVTVATLPAPPLDSSAEAGTLGNVAMAITQVGNGMVASVNPVAESIARSLEFARDALAERSNNADSSNEGAVTDTKSSAASLFDISVEIAGASNLPLWRRGLAILLGLGAWLIRYWLWVIAAVLSAIAWRMMRKRHKY